MARPPKGHGLAAPVTAAESNHKGVRVVQEDFREKTDESPRQDLQSVMRGTPQRAAEGSEQVQAREVAVRVGNRVFDRNPGGGWWWYQTLEWQANAGTGIDARGCPVWSCVDGDRIRIQHGDHVRWFTCDELNGVGRDPGLPSIDDEWFEQLHREDGLITPTSELQTRIQQLEQALSDIQFDLINCPEAAGSRSCAHLKDAIRTVNAALQRGD